MNELDIAWHKENDDVCRLEVELKELEEFNLIHKDENKLLRDELAALKQSQGEPVAYIHKWKLHAATMGRSLSFQNRSPHGDDMEITPLFTFSPNQS